MKKRGNYEESADNAVQELIDLDPDPYKDMIQDDENADSSYSSEWKRLQSFLDRTNPSDVCLVGYVICEKESTAAESVSIDDMYDLLVEELERGYGAYLDKNMIFRTDADKIYIITQEDKTFSDAKKALEIKWNLWAKHNIYVAYFAKRGTSCKNIHTMYNEVSWQLIYLKNNAAKHPNCEKPDIPGIADEKVDDKSSEIVTPALSSPIITGNIADQLVGALRNDEKLSALKKNANGIHIIEEQEDDTDEVSDGPHSDDRFSERSEDQETAEPIDNAYTVKESVIDNASPDPGNTDSGNGNISDETIEEITETEEDPVKEVRLIDSENVAVSWKNILSDDPGKKTIILYTDNTPKISYDDMPEILKHPHGITFQKVYPGEKGASGLDFQLVSILGFMLNEYPDRDYIIVSRDSGYDPVVRYWKDKGYHVSRLPMVNRDLPEGTKAFCSLSDEGKEKVKDACTNQVEKSFHTPSAAAAIKITDPMAASAGKKFDKICFLQKIIPGRKRPVYEDIMKILDSHDENDFGHIHADFKDIFGGNHGERMYKKIKGRITDYKLI